MTTDQFKYYTKVANRYVKNWEIAEEMVQEALLRISQKTYDNFDGYLKKTIKNLCLNRMERVENRYSYERIHDFENGKENEDGHINYFPEALKTKNNPEIILARKQERKRIKSWSNTLPGAQKEAFKAYIFTGDNLRQAAEKHNKNWETFRRSYGVALSKWKKENGY